MPTTPIYGLRYPAATDPADVPLDMQKLALDVEGAAPTKFPGAQLAYVEFTAPVVINATSEAAANTIVTAPAVMLDGSTAVFVEFFAWGCAPNQAAGANLIVVLYLDGASIGQWALFVASAAGGYYAPARLARRLIPASGSRTFSVRAYISPASGAGSVSAGPGGVGQAIPGYIRIVRA